MFCDCCEANGQICVIEQRYIVIIIYCLYGSFHELTVGWYKDVHKLSHICHGTVSHNQHMDFEHYIDSLQIYTFQNMFYKDEYSLFYYVWPTFVLLVDMLNLNKTQRDVQEYIWGLS